MRDSNTHAPARMPAGDQDLVRRQQVRGAGDRPPARLTAAAAG